MRLRGLAVSLGVSLCAAALATLIVTWMTTGHGVVTNLGGRSARFEVSASKVQRVNTAVVVSGSFVLDFSTETVIGNKLTCHPDEYSQDGNTSWMAGPAVFRLVTKDGTHELHGRARARFTSNKHPDEAGDLDTLEMNFTAADAPFTFGFGGKVTTGDVTVSRTDSY